MPEIHLPAAWMLVAPCGCVDGVTLAVLDGRILCATAEEAWQKFTHLKRDRDREAKQGFRIEPAEDLPPAMADCSHEPKWGIQEPGGAVR